VSEAQALETYTGHGQPAALLQSNSEERDMSQDLVLYCDLEPGVQFTFA
jgi:hypothetical protein